MKMLRKVLLIVLIVCLAYLAVYAVQEQRVRKQNETIGRPVQELRMASTPVVEQGVALAVTENPTEAPTDEPEVTETTFEAPTDEPEMTEMPSEAPADEPEVTETPSEAPTDEPEMTENPTEAPTDEPEVTEAPTDAPAKTPEATAAPTAAPAAEDPLLMYYRELAARNADMIGWIHIDDTVIDYPVMYTPEDEEFYLHKNFEKSYSFAGTPFIDARCSLDERSDNLIVYAHNMKNGTMFGQLRKYLDAEFFSEHPMIYFDTLEERGEYHVFAVIPVYLARMNDERMRCYGVSMTEDEAQLQALRKYVETYAVFSDPDALPQVGGDVLTLSTCTGFRDADRLVIMATKLE